MELFNSSLEYISRLNPFVQSILGCVVFAFLVGVFRLSKHIAIISTKKSARFLLGLSLGVVQTQLVTTYPQRPT